MIVSIVPTQDQTLATLRSVLLLAVASGTEIVLAQSNRVPTPSSPNYVVMTPLRRPRLATNSIALDDCRMIGEVSGTTLTVAAVTFGTVTPGRNIWAAGGGIPDGTTIVRQLTGVTGTIGTYLLSATGAVGTDTVIAAGVLTVTAPFEFDVQLDCHGTGASDQAADNAQIISALFRDDWAVQRFAELRADVIPLHADDPRFMPGFVDGEDQYEDRWIVEARLQINAVIQLPQQYADRVAAGLIDVDVEYPA